MIGGLRNLSNSSSDICCLCCATIEFCGNPTGINELIVDGLPANTYVGIGIVSILFVISCDKSPRPCGLWIWSSFLFVVRKGELLEEDLGENQT